LFVYIAIVFIVAVSIQNALAINDMMLDNLRCVKLDVSIYV